MRIELNETELATLRNALQVAYQNHIAIVEQLNATAGLEHISAQVFAEANAIADLRDGLPKPANLKSK